MGHFPLPRLVVRVGLTGHRPNRLNLPATLVGERIGTVLDLVSNAARRIETLQQGLYEASPPVLRLTTGLARGTDEIGATAAVERDWELQSVIAFDRRTFADLAVADCNDTEADAYRTRYARLLERSASVLELLGKENGGLRRDAHELVGNLVLEQSDVLIGVWDGQPARGLGGTAHLMRLALQLGLPVVWIHATDADCPVTVRFPDWPGEHGLETLADWLIASLVLDPDAVNAPTSGGDGLRRWRDFVAENDQRTGRFVPLFQYLLMLGGKKRPKWRLPAMDSERNWRDNWQAFRDAVATVDERIAVRIEEALQRPFHRADHLAEVYGRAYRGAYVSIYLLAAFATAIGLFGLFFHAIKPILVGVELAMIIGMVGVTLTGRHHRWHERWLEYRAIAEQLRQARMGAWSAQSLEPGNPVGDGSHAETSWVSWYVRACVRQLPMIHARATADYVRLALETIRRQEIDDQLRFNRNTSDVQARVHERLEGIESILLYVLIAACIAFFPALYLGADQSHDLVGSAMTFVGALVPALGAALLGMRSQGDFDAYAERSEDTARQLERIAERIDEAGAQADFETLVDMVDGTTEALAGDVFAWRTVYRRKALTVSA